MRGYFGCGHLRNRSAAGVGVVRLLYVDRLRELSVLPMTTDLPTVEGNIGVDASTIGEHRFDGKTKWSAGRAGGLQSLL